MTLTDLTVMLILLCIALLLWQHFEVSQLAYRAAKSYTQKMGLTLLDQSIVLKGLALRKSPNALCAIERCYHFEFSSLGDQRYPGKIIFIGKKQQSIELSPHKTLEPREPLE